MSARCHFCGRPPVDPIPAGSLTIDGRAVNACFACAAAWDDEDERRTLEGAAFGLPPPEPATVYQLRRHKGADLTGQRFGNLLVEGVVLQQRGRWVSKMWTVRCKCGRASIVNASDLRRGRKSCQWCANAATARARYTRRGGVNLFDLARRAGLPPDTVQKRYQRGWPVEKLTMPLLRPATRRAA
jgi:hypothetical protein